MKRGKRYKPTPGVLGLFILMAAVLSFQSGSRGYIMPAEQLIEFMAANFAKFRTVIIDRAILVKTDEGEEGEEAFNERIWIESPHFFHAEMMDPGKERGAVPDNLYMQLLVSNRKDRLVELLAGLGVNFQSVAFTRIEGAIAFRIGDEGPDRPKILIEKERFLPLLLIYRVRGVFGPENVAVRFGDYRELEQGWFPFEISYSSGGEVRETYTILTLKANEPVNVPLSRISAIQAEPADAGDGDANPSDQERIESLIKTFEKKHSQSP